MERTGVTGQRVRVTQNVLDGLEAVRQGGLTNMFDRPMVAQLAHWDGFYETAEWVEEHPKEYATGILYGFTMEGESDD